MSSSNPPLRHFRLTLAYDGGAFVGWQVQAAGVSVQGALETALAPLCDQPVRVVGSGRTDAGVHALGQVASFSASCRHDADTLRRALNASLPPQIHVLRLQETRRPFHALREAKWKRYAYWIQDGPVANVFNRDYAWRVVSELNVSAMEQASRLLQGRLDFKSFEAAGAERRTSVRTVRELTVQRTSQSALRPAEAAVPIRVQVQADGFLYNMVRNIVGSLVQVGLGKRPPAWIGEVLAARDRTAAGPTAPPQGLFLVEVTYEPLEEQQQQQSQQ